MNEYIVKLTKHLETGVISGTLCTKELVRCNECTEHGKRTNYCAIWKCNTSPDGYCHRGRK